MKYHYAVLLCAGFLAASPGAFADATNTANRNAAVGMNLGRNYYYAPELPFLNVLRKAIPWRESPAGAPGFGAAEAPGLLALLAVRRFSARRRR